MNDERQHDAVVAYVPDLMDRSRFSGRDVRFLATLADLVALGPTAGTVVVDLARPGALDAAIALAAERGDGPRVVGFAPHVDDELRSLAADGGVEVVPRSRFFARLDEVLSSRR